MGIFKRRGMAEAQHGTTRWGYAAGMLLCLALGCTARTPEPGGAGTAAMTGGSGGRGSQGTAGWGGASAGGVGTAGVGGASATGGWSSTGGFPSTPQMCSSHPPAPLYGCVHGDALREVGDHMVMASMTGVVEAAEPGAPSCYEEALTYLGNSASGMQRYAVVSEAAALQITLGSPSERPILELGQTANITYENSHPFGTPAEGTLIVRDEMGKAVYWLTQSSHGPVDLSPPAGITIEIGAYRCLTEVECGESDWGGTLVVRDGNERIELEFGASADLGEHTVFAVSNSTFTSNGACVERVSHHTIAVGFLPRGALSPCYGLAESTCSAMEGCQSVSAYFDPQDPSPRFVACVEEGSCSDGDLTTCAFNPRTGELAAFTTTCVPPGWTPYGDQDCRRDDMDAGAP